MTNNVIEVANLSKAYQVYKRPKDLFLEVVTKKTYHDLFWALRDVSFTVKSGQRLGIIGPNGAGKSTLLQIIAGNLNATSGSVTVNGSVSALLSLVPSWNVEESGIENIKFNLLLRGCSGETIESKLQEIVDFAELGQFIHQPVKTYSAGMSARLSFAIATAIIPEILIVDEVLGAGDGYFAGKAVRRMKELCDNGKALLFVSHSTPAVQMMCETVLWIDGGSARMIGPAEEVLSLYEEDCRKNEESYSKKRNFGNPAATPDSSANPEDFEDTGYYRMRLVSLSDDRIFHDTHYVRRIGISVNGTNYTNADLANSSANTDSISDIRLELHKSEWGRYVNSYGTGCVTLHSRTGKNRGGHILFKALQPEKRICKQQVVVEAKSYTGKERLGLELLNYQTGKWEMLTQISNKKLSDGWEEIIADLTLEQVGEDEIKSTLTDLKNTMRRPIEILDISVRQRDSDVVLIKDKSSFAIVVKIRANKLVEKFDVMIKVFRSDGVYTFWQSSGMSGQNYSNLLGEIEVAFNFDDNMFGPGDYLVGATAANGFDLENNFPYSEIYDFRVNAVRFSISRAHSIFLPGIINTKVPVTLKALN